MFKLIHNRKGISLVELIVTVAVVGLVIVLSSTVFSMFANTHEMAATRWQVQNAVRLSSTKFETETDLIANSKMLDIFYDETIANGILYDEATNTFTWKDGKTPYVVPNEGSKDEDFSYIFSTPAYDKNNPDHYLGYFLYIKNFGETSSKLFLDNEGFGDVPVQIEYIDEKHIRVKYTDGKAVTPGQACVVYLGEQCLMGGIIKQVFKDGKDLWYLK